jgi:hypothetical protein
MNRWVIGCLLVLAACTTEPHQQATRSAPPSPIKIGTSDVWTLSQGGWSFGECTGWCVGQVSFTARGEVILTLHNAQDERTKEFTGELSPVGVQTLASATIRVGGLRNVYGCPDCTDGGASFLTWSKGTAEFTATYDYGSPPAQLQSQYRFVDQVMDALKACKTNEVIGSTSSGACGDA